MSLTTAEIREWIEEYDAGKSVREIAHDFGRSYTMVRVELGARITMRRRGRAKKRNLGGRPPSPRDGKRWERWYLSGKSVAEIADLEECSASKVYRCLTQRGVEMRPCGGERATITTRDVREWIEEYGRDKSTVWISDRYGCSPETVARHLKAAGVELRDRGPVPVSGAKVLELRAYGVTREDIADRLGLSGPAAVSNVTYRERKKRRSNAASA